MGTIVVSLVVLVLLGISTPALAAKTGDFEVGGYVKLHLWWDSTAMGKNLNTPAPRTSAPQPAQTGRFRAQASDTRLNVTVKGPEVWGAKTQGYVEFDFETGADARQSASNSYVPRLRHAWFRMDWPGGWQVLMGQYWGVFCNFYPETLQSSPFQFHGMATQRLAQIRVSKTTGPWTVTGFVATPYNPDNATDNPVAAFNGLGTVPGLPGSNNFQGWESSTPQFGVQAQFEKDLYGQAAFYGAPRGFTANVSFGVQRSYYYAGQITAAGGALGSVTWGQDNFTAVGDQNFARSESLTPWCIQTTWFIPVLPTHTPDLRGTVSLTLQFYLGQGLSAFGMGQDADNSFFRFDGRVVDPAFAANDYFVYKRELTKAYGGYAQLQYYFTNAWFLGYVFGFQKAYGLPQDRNAVLANFQAGNPNGYEYLANQDQVKFWQEHDLTLFYHPIKAFKFGLGYSFMRTEYLQIRNYGTSRNSSVGDNHRVQFAGWFFF